MHIHPVKLCDQSRFKGHKGRKTKSKTPKGQECWVIHLVNVNWRIDFTRITGAYARKMLVQAMHLLKALLGLSPPPTKCH